MLTGYHEKTASNPIDITHAAEVQRSVSYSRYAQIRNLCRFIVKQQAFQLVSELILTGQKLFSRYFSSSPPSSSLQPPSQPSQKLTLVYPFGVKNLKALA